MTIFRLGIVCLSFGLLFFTDDASKLQFSPVKFDPDKFTSDKISDAGRSPKEPDNGVYPEQLQACRGGEKGKGGDEKKDGSPLVAGSSTWQDGNAPTTLTKDCPQADPNAKKDDNLKEDLSKLSDEEKYMRALGEACAEPCRSMGDTCAEPSRSVGDAAKSKPIGSGALKKKLKQIQSKYGVGSINSKPSGEGTSAELSDQLATVLVTHKDQNNKNNPIEAVPEVEDPEKSRVSRRVKLLSGAELKKQLDEAKACPELSRRADLETALKTLGHPETGATCAEPRRSITKSQAEVVAEPRRSAIAHENDLGHDVIDGTKVTVEGEEVVIYGDTSTALSTGVEGKWTRLIGKPLLKGMEEEEKKKEETPAAERESGEKEERESEETEVPQPSFEVDLGAVKEKFTDQAKEGHTLFFKVIENRNEMYIASEEREIHTFITEKLKEAKDSKNSDLEAKVLKVQEEFNKKVKPKMENLEALEELQKTKGGQLTKIEAEKKKVKAGLMDISKILRLLYVECGLNFFGHPDKTEEVKKKAQSELQSATDKENEDIGRMVKENYDIRQKDPKAELKNNAGNFGLSSSEFEAANNPAKIFLGPIFYGTVLEKMVAPKVASKFQHFGTANKWDFQGIGEYDELIFDITTKKSEAEHRSRFYGPHLIFAFYLRIPDNFGNFEKPA